MKYFPETSKINNNNVTTQITIYNVSEFSIKSFKVESIDLTSFLLTRPQKLVSDFRNSTFLNSLLLSTI